MHLGNCCLFSICLIIVAIVALWMWEKRYPSS